VIVAGGELVANGTVNGTLQGLSVAGYTGGRYVANASTAAISADSSWTGTYVVGWNPGDSNTAFDINNYGTAATATIQIDGVNGEFAAFPREGDTVANVTAKIVLNANWSIGNGWSGLTNTFAYLTGSGNISVSNVSGYTYGRIFNIKDLDGYTGTLGGANGVFVVDKVNVATQPADGARVVKTNIGANGSINDNVPLYVGGVDSGKTLTYDASGAEGAGLYYYEPVVSYAVRFFSDAEKQDQIGDTQSVVSGEKATAPEAPTKTGYTFTGWDPDTNDVIVAATDFVAQWSADGYTITFDANGGSVDPATTNFTIESGTITLPTPTHSGVGVTFNGWTNATYTTGIKSFTPAAGNLGNFTLVADWTVPGPATEVNPVSNDPVPVTATDAEDAKSQVDVAVPKSGAVADAIATGQAADPTYDYAKNFDKVATYDTESGKWEVTVKIAEAVEEAVATTAEAIVSGTADSGKVTVPAGLYYKVTTYTTLGGTPSVVIGTTLSTGAASSAISKPGTAQGQGFIKVEMATTAEELAD